MHNVGGMAAWLAFIPQSFDDVGVAAGGKRSVAAPIRLSEAVMAASVAGVSALAWRHNDGNSNM